MAPSKDVTFNLWAVLLGIVLLGGAVFSLLYADQKETKARQQDISQQVTINTTSLTYIVEGIKELKQGQQAVMRSIEETQREIKARDRREPR